MKSFFFMHSLQTTIIYYELYLFTSEGFFLMSFSDLHPLLSLSILSVLCPLQHFLCVMLYCLKATQTKDSHPV